MANMWIYDDKSIFLQKASGALLFASIVYVGMNMIVMFFPHIMYGLPLEVKEFIFANDSEQTQIVNVAASSDLIAENSEETEQANTTEKKEGNKKYKNMKN